MALNDITDHTNKVDDNDDDDANDDNDDDFDDDDDIEIVSGSPYNLTVGLDPNERAALRALENFLQNDPMAILQMHVENKNLRLLDLFRDLDKNSDYMIGVEDLKRKVKVRYAGCGRNRRRN